METVRCAQKNYTGLSQGRSQVKESMTYQAMNLNISYDLSSEVWENEILKIYEEMDGWIGFETDNTKGTSGLPHWFSFNPAEKHIYASVEPSGLHFSGLMDDEEWEIWKKKMKTIATEKLGYKVGEIELGEI